MRLNALSPSENPMEQLLYCFGGPDDGGGGGGGGGGGSTHPGRPGGESGERGNRSDRGDGNDRDDRGGGFDPGFDEGDVGGNNDMGPGSGGAFMGDIGFDEGDTGDTGDTGGFGGFGGRDGTAGAAGSNIDDLIEQSTAFGYGPNIQSTDVPSQAEVSAAIAAGVPAVQAQTTGFTAPSVGAGLTGRAPGDMGGDTSIERDVFGTDEDEYSTQDIFEVDPTGLGFETPQERIAREKAENTRAAARAAAAERAKVASDQAQREALQRSLGISERDIALQTQLDEAMAPERARQAEEDALAAQLGAEADANRAARESRPSDRGIESLMGGTVFGAPDVTGQAEDIGNNRSAAAPGINVNIGPVESQSDVDRAADEALAATGLSTPTADIEVTYSPSNVLSPDAARAVDQSIDRAISDFAGYRIGRTQEMDDQGNITTDDFALSRDLVSQPPAYGAAYSPAEQLRMQEGAEALPAISVPDIDVFGAKIPSSIVGRVASDILSPASAVERALREGATPVPDEQGRIVGAVDERGTVYSISPFSDIMSGIRGELPSGMEEAYAQQRAIQDAERERGGGDGGGQPIIPPIEDIFEEPQAPERVPFELDEYQYDPMAPVQYSYTGLPTLAPFVLRPSRTSNRDFIRPTYDFGGLGSLRRS